MGGHRRLGVGGRSADVIFFGLATVTSPISLQGGLTTTKCSPAFCRFLTQNTHTYFGASAGSPGEIRRFPCSTSQHLPYSRARAEHFAPAWRSRKRALADPRRRQPRSRPVAGTPNIRALTAPSTLPQAAVAGGPSPLRPRRYRFLRFYSPVFADAARRLLVHVQKPHVLVHRAPPPWRSPPKMANRTRVPWHQDPIPQRSI